jgi:hypothetical protein
MSTTGFKTLSGSFSRYSNEILKDFFEMFLSKKLEIWDFHPSIMATTGFQTLSGSFSRYSNEFLKYFFHIFFWPKYVEKMKFCP